MIHILSVYVHCIEVLYTERTEKMVDIVEASFFFTPYSDSFHLKYNKEYNQSKDFSH
jgi:hypothetical protein